MTGGERAHASRTLRALLRDTQRALQEVADILQIDAEVLAAVQEIAKLSARPLALVIFGTSPTARARLLHCLLGRKLLPDNLPRCCKWLRVRYGSSTQVHLTLGNSEFELVEELESNKRKWDTLPVEDLTRTETMDLATMLEVELNTPLLSHGLPIILPPTFNDDSPPSLLSLKQKYSELYSKREAILKNFNPVYLYAVDKIGKNIYSDNFVPNTMKTKGEEDFWSLLNVYDVSRTSGEQDGDDNGDGDQEVGDGDEKCEMVGRRSWTEKRGAAVFNVENCLDIHQAKEINPHAQFLFILLGSSQPIQAEGRVRVCGEATESVEDNWCSAQDLPESDQGMIREGGKRHTKVSSHSDKSATDPRRLKEKQIAFMNELLDQWELMSPPPPKHYVKSQSLIIDDTEIFQWMEQRPLSSTLGTTLSPGGARSKRAGEEQAAKNRTLVSAVVKFWSENLQSYVLQYSTKLSEVHLKLLQQFILASFDMARELQVVPKKIQYVASQEKQLYEIIKEKFSEGEKKQEMLQIMQEVLAEIKTNVEHMDWSVDDLPWHQDKRYHVSNSVFYHYQRKHERVHLSGLTRLFEMSGASDVSGVSGSDASGTLSDGEEAVSCDSCNFDEYDIILNGNSSSGSDFMKTLCMSDVSGVSGSDASGTLSDGEEAVSSDSCNFDEYDIILNGNSSSGSYVMKANEEEDTTTDIGSIRIENESETSGVWSTLLRSGWAGASSATTVCTSASVSLKQASLDVQQTVLAKLSRMISLKLVKFLDCLQDTYFGTLQRCLESLESSCRQELGGRPASEAMRQLLSVARQVDLQPCASFSLVRSMVESLRRLFHKLRVVGGGSEDACCVLSPVWRRQVALSTAHSLSPHRLARLISQQILERLSSAHERYQAALASLESALKHRLHHAMDTKLAIRTTYAPSFARLCLESTSLCDLLMHGTPELGREIGRGQYGVVYALKGAWAGRAPAAVKSVLPADRRHYYELAMEFFYTRSIPAHPRIVPLYGSIVQRHSGTGPSVLLITERKVRDLHCAVRQGLSFVTRMRIAIDIVEGIRYLHSFGLVHRDIKMKNVLLDAQDRASLSDLGFCAAEALITGSVVGTPMHMAPELLAREYDASVDVYAFGILFWYLCAGNVTVPSAFETFLNKEQLWKNVKKGVRPECLPYFLDDCWEIMKSCWAPEPSQRAHLGDIQPKLERIYKEALRDGYDSVPYVDAYTDYSGLSDDDSYLTGMDRGMSSMVLAGP